MKPDLHPQYNEINVTCSCGNAFKARSVLDHDLHVDVCSQCHPFYTGKQKIVDTAGRVESFNRRFRRGRTSAANSAENNEKSKD